MVASLYQNLFCFLPALLFLLQAANTHTPTHRHTHRVRKKIPAEPHTTMSQHGRPGLVGRQAPVRRNVQPFLWDHMKARGITASVWSSETKLIYCWTQHLKHLKQALALPCCCKKSEEWSAGPLMLLFHFTVTASGGRPGEATYLLQVQLTKISNF